MLTYMLVWSPGFESAAFNDVLPQANTTAHECKPVKEKAGKSHECFIEAENFKGLLD